MWLALWEVGSRGRDAAGHPAVLREVPPHNPLQPTGRRFRSVTGTEEAVLFVIHLGVVVMFALLLSGCFLHTSELFMKSDEQFLYKDIKKYYASDFSFQAQRGKGSTE